MIDALEKEVNEKFPGKVFLTIQEASELLGCNEMVIYNWTRRPNPKKRPPKIVVGKSIRFPKRAFLDWLVGDQTKPEK